MSVPFILLPFQSLGANEDHAALVDGFRLSIHCTLVKLSGLFLVNGSALEVFRDVTASPAEAGLSAGVRYVLEGAAQIAGQRIRFTAELTDAFAGQSVWAEQYDRPLNNVFELQDEITAEVVTQIRIHTLLDDSTSTYAWWDDLPDWKARQSALKGLSYFYKGSPADNLMARRQFQEIINLWPEHGQGIALVALTHWVEGFRGWSSSIKRSQDISRVLAEHALEYGDQDGLAAMILGHDRLMRERHDEALELARRSALIRMSCPMANGLYARTLLYAGEPGTAVDRIKYAIRIQRLCPPWMVNVLSEAYRDLGDIHASVQVARESFRLDGENLDTQAILCADCMMAGTIDEGHELARRILRTNPKFCVNDYVDSKPYRDPEQRHLISNALRDAGL